MSIELSHLIEIVLPFSHCSLSSSFTGKVFVPKQKPIEKCQEEVTTLDPELEEALSSATDTELCDLAGKIKSKNKLRESATHGCCICEKLCLNSSLCCSSKTQAPFTLTVFP